MKVKLLSELPSHLVDVICVKYVHNPLDLIPFVPHVKVLHIKHSMVGNDLWFWISYQRWGNLQCLKIPSAYSFSLYPENFPVLVNFMAGGLTPAAGYFSQLSTILSTNRFRRKMAITAYLSLYKNPFPREIAMKIALYVHSMPANEKQKRRKHNKDGV